MPKPKAPADPLAPEKKSEPAVSPARQAALAKLIANGYEVDGVHRKVRSIAHALFLSRAGGLALPD